jgi:hypothetical protein
MAWGIETFEARKKQCLEASYRLGLPGRALKVTVLEDKFERLPSWARLVRTRRPKNQFRAHAPIASACDGDWLEFS